MSARREVKILRVGSIGFPLALNKWYAEVEVSSRWKVEFHETENFVNDIGFLKGFDLIRMSRSWARDASTLFAAAAPLITQTKFVDLIFKKNGILWPYLAHKDAIHSIVLERYPYLNTKSAGLLIGLTTESILSAACLVELGLKHITFVVEDEERDSTILKQLEKSLFEVRLEMISKDKVILLPGIYSVVICYEDLRTQAELLTALLYFNYLERGGLVINAAAPLEKLPLMEEAFAIGAKVVDLHEVQIHEELVSLQKVIPLSQSSFQHLLALALSENQSLGQLK